MSDLTERIWSESAIAARPGQTARLEAIAREVEHLAARCADMEAQRDAASMRSGEWARRNWNASADMKGRIRDAWDEGYDACWNDVDAGAGPGEWTRNPYRALLDAAPAGGAE